MDVRDEMVLWSLNGYCFWCLNVYCLLDLMVCVWFMIYCDDSDMSQ